ncbi:Por secretion system C-terminal sorting domain-containing protein [Ekhidna lutea]|uniref:Por secretion system C-terminal sorting domain-containing protein n=1 Tax=Ekhidna lutea TaxID=447679 RepID=A0A239LCG9_EKHLU|nr:choice-of-anchor D domain-containing protein [Ekhidna lutea]SNT28336.1 Por secretion system C-terminal sorting domain-containing protein [Ekhidna lutea]
MHHHHGPLKAFFLLSILCVTASFNQAFSQIGRSLSGDLAKQKVKFAKEVFVQNENVIKKVKFDRETRFESIQDFNASLSLSSANDLAFAKKVRDKIGYEHLKYSQKFKGYEVLGGEMIFHCKDGVVKTATGKVIQNLHVNTDPQLSEKQALEIAMKKIGAETYMWQNLENEKYLKQFSNDPNTTYFPEGKLVISQKGYNANAPFALVYQFDIYAEAPIGKYNVEIDAITGEIVNFYNKLHLTASTGQGNTLYDGAVDIDTELNVDEYSLSDLTRGDGIHTYNMGNGTNYASATPFIDSDGDFIDENQRTGVSAHYGAAATYDYFFNSFGRNSYDNSGAAINSFVHYSSNYFNAFWDGSRMTYGDGDGVTATALVSLDIVGHEITHAVTQHSANLVYAYESGALNESFSDIFGQSVEFETFPATASWNLADQIYTDGISMIRSMSDPNSQGDPDTYQGNNWEFGDFDNGGVHINSGVMNYWYFLLVDGGIGTNDNGYAYDVPSIGRSAAEQIAYRNLTVYLTSTSQYVDARVGSELAAIDLYGENSTEHLAVIEAWNAVGVPSADPVLATTDNIDFGQVPVGFTMDVEVTVTNQGNALLSISSISSNDAQFTTSTSTLNVAESSAETFVVSFTPELTGSHSASLLLTSNGGDHTITMTGNAVDPPVIEVSPASISESLFTGDSIGTVITISNTGDSDLIGTINVNEITPAYTYNYTATRSLPSNASSFDSFNEPEMIQAVSGESEEVNILVIQDYSAWGVYLNQFIIDNFGITPTVINSASLSSTDLSLFDVVLTAGDQSSTYYNAISNHKTQLEEFAQNGGVIAYLLATQGSNVEIVGDANVVYGNLEDTNIVIDDTHPITEGLPTELLGSSANHTHLENLPAGTRSLVTNEISQDTTLAVYSYGSGTVIATGMTVEFLYNNDYNSAPLLGEIIAFSIDQASSQWVSLDHSDFNIKVDSTATLNLSINAEGIYGGIYDFNVSFDSNDPSNPSIEIPVTLDVTGIPDINIPIESLDFESKFIGGTYMDSLEIENLGTDLLTITEVTSDNLVFSAYMSDAEISAEESGYLIVNYSPDAVGTQSGTITITSNDPETSSNTISISGTGQEPPVMVISPSEINLDLFTGETAIEGILLDNSDGGADLEWAIEIIDSVNIDVEFEKESFADWTLAENQDCITENVCLTRANSQGLFNIAAETSFSSNSPIGTEWARGTTENPTSEYMTWRQAVEYCPPCHLNETFSLHLIDEDIYFDVVFLSWDQGDTEGGGFSYLRSPASSGWITLEKEFGVVPAGQLDVIQASFNASGLNAGIYNSGLVFTSNDPVNHTDTVAINMNVTGIPEVEVSKTSIDFGNIYIGSDVTDSIVVSNSGTDSLIVTNASLSNTLDYSIDTTSFKVPPGESIAIKITYAPDTAEEDMATLTIENNDSDEGSIEIDLTGIGVAPPIISVDPISLEESLLTGETSIQSINIENIEGGSTLSWTIDFNYPETLTVLYKENEHLVTYESSSFKSSDNNTGLAKKGPLSIDQINSLAGNIDILAWTGYTDFSREYPNTLNAISQYFTDYTVTTTDTEDPTELGTLLGASDVFLIPEQEGGYNAYYENLSTSWSGELNDFVSNGGKIILCGSSSGAHEILNANGLMTMSFVEQSSPLLQVTDQTHPITNGLPESIAGQNATMLMNLIDVSASSLVSYEDNMVVAVKELGRGSIIYIGFDFYDYDDNAALLISNAVTYEGNSSWISSELSYGTVEVGSTQSVNINFNATALEGGTHTAELLIQSNDPSNPVIEVPITLEVTAAPDISVSSSSFDLGEVFVGQTSQMELEVNNEGTALLQVASAELSNNVDFGIDISSFDLSPGETQLITITYDPQAAGIHNSTLTITSDDHDEPTIEMSLSGESILPPVIGTSVSSIEEALEIDQTSVHELTIDNTSGGSDLTYSIDVIFENTSVTALNTTGALVSNPGVIGKKEQNITNTEDTYQSNISHPNSLTKSNFTTADIEQVLLSLNERYLEVTDLIPDRYNFYDGEYGTSISDGGGDMYDGGNYLSTDLGGNIQYTNGEILESAYLNNAQYFTVKYPGLFAFVGDVSDINTFSINGNLGADGGGSVDGSVLSIEVGGVNYLGFIKRVYNAFDPSVNHLIIIEDNGVSNHEFSLNTNDDFHQLIDIGENSNLYYLLFAGESGRYIDDTEIGNIMSSFLDIVDDRNWLSVSSSGGTISAGSSESIDVAINASELVSGNYDASIRVQSNDPANGVIDIPVALNVSKKSQSITFGTLSDKLYSESEFSLTASASSGLEIAYSSSNTEIATISGNTVQIVGVGETIITASQPGDETYSAAEDVQQTLTISKGEQSISFDELELATYGDESISLSASSTSGLAVSYSSSDESVAIIEDGIINITGVGSAIITASQGGDENYEAAESIEQTLVVNKGVQDIVFSEIDNKIYGDEPFELIASGGGSGNEIIFTSSNPDIVSISGTEAIIMSAGEVSIIASQAGNDLYQDAQSIERIVVVEKATQELSMEPMSDKIYGDDPFELDAWSSSGLDVTLTSSDTSVAMVEGHIVNIVGAGNATITATQDGNNNYKSAKSISEPLVVNKSNQQISFDAISTKFYGSADFELSVSSSSSLPVTLSSSDTSVAKINDGVVSLLNAGLTIITAVQEGDQNYNAAIDVQQVLHVERSNQEITVNEIPDKVYGDEPFSIEATGGDSGNPVTITSSDTTIISVTGNLATILGAGNVILTLQQSGNANYADATKIESVTISKADQEISFEQIPDYDLNTSNDPVELNASTSSGLEVSYSISGPASLDGTMLIMNDAGIVTVVASQNGNRNFNAASNAIVSFEVIGIVLGLDEEVSILMYPNPASEFIYFENLKNLNGVEAQILSLDGRIIQTSGINNQKIDLSNLKTGIYMILLKQDENIIYKSRLVVE